MALAPYCTERAVAVKHGNGVPNLVVPGQVTAGRTQLTMPNEGSTQVAVEQVDIVQHEVITQM